MSLKQKINEFHAWLKEREESTEEEFRQKGWRPIKFEVTAIKEKFEQIFGKE
jgi:hypothetical protein